MSDVQQRIMELRNLQSQQGKLTDMQKQELQELEYQKPTFGNNLWFFMNYQIRHMYLRYFMWNFVGRFNDQQAVSGNDRFDGNWYSGIGIIDRMVTGPSKGLPETRRLKMPTSFYP